jgi:hypothetical protein
MIRSVEYFDTEVEAEQEGQRCQALLGPGYGYSYRVWFDTSGQVWVLDSSRYSSCD